MDFLEPALSEVESLIKRAFAEDFANEDLTSNACLPESSWARADLVLKQIGCIAGLKFLPWIFQLHDPRIKAELFVREGEMCDRSTLLAKIEGPAHSVLSAERVAVNFLQHLSGVASLTARCVAKARGTKCQILDTRKTILGLRSLQKYAVRMGGGTNHRFHLADRILIKNNHLAFSSIQDCIARARAAHPLGWIEVEIGAIDQLESALTAGADAVLLDNMSPQEVRQCVLLSGKKVYLEASGGISIENLAAYAESGVDGISIGALTHSAPALDISLRVRS